MTRQMMSPSERDLADALDDLAGATPIGESFFLGVDRRVRSHQRRRRALRSVGALTAAAVTVSGLLFVRAAQSPDPVVTAAPTAVALPSCTALLAAAPPPALDEKAAVDSARADKVRAHAAKTGELKATGTVTAAAADSVTIAVDPKFSDGPSAITATTNGIPVPASGTKVAFLVALLADGSGYQLEAIQPAPTDDKAALGDPTPDDAAGQTEHKAMGTVTAAGSGSVTLAVDPEFSDLPSEITASTGGTPVPAAGTTVAFIVAPLPDGSGYRLEAIMPAPTDDKANEHDPASPKAGDDASTAAHKAMGTVTAAGSGSVTLAVDPAFSDLPSEITASTGGTPVPAAGTTVAFIVAPLPDGSGYRLEAIMPAPTDDKANVVEVARTAAPPADGTKGAGTLGATPDASAVTIAVTDGLRAGETISLVRTASTVFMVGQETCDPAGLPAGTPVVFVAAGDQARRVVAG